MNYLNYLDIFPDDVIIKILDTRCNDIERELNKLQYKLEWFKEGLEGFTIEKKSDLELKEELEEYVLYNNNYTRSYNNRYTINFNNIKYCSNNYLYETIYEGVCVMSYRIIYLDDDGEIEEYSLFESDLVRNPTILDLLRFTTRYIDDDEDHLFADGFSVLEKASRVDKQGLNYDTISLYLDF